LKVETWPNAVMLFVTNIADKLTTVPPPCSQYLHNNYRGFSVDPKLHNETSNEHC